MPAKSKTDEVTEREAELISQLNEARQNLLGAEVKIAQLQDVIAKKNQTFNIAVSEIERLGNLVTALRTTLDQEVDGRRAEVEIYQGAIDCLHEQIDLLNTDNDNSLIYIGRLLAGFEILRNDRRIDREIIDQLFDLLPPFICAVSLKAR